MVVFDSGMIFRSSVRRRARRGGATDTGGVIEDVIDCSAYHGDGRALVHRGLCARIRASHKRRRRMTSRIERVTGGPAITCGGRGPRRSREVELRRVG